MKKIKLLTGLSALSTLGISALPLTSCNKNTIVEVTEAEWKNALDYAANYETNWCFGQDSDYFAGGDYVSETDYILSSYNKWINNEQGVYAKGLLYQADKETSLVEIFEKRLDGGFSYGKHTRIEEGEEDIQHIIRDNQVSATWAFMFYSMYDYQSSFTFDDKGYYNYAGVLGEIITTNTKIKFGSDKKIQHFVVSASYPTFETHRQLFACDVHFNYSKQNIPFDKEFLERVDKHCFKMNNTESIVFNPAIYLEQREGLVFSIIPPENKTYHTISAYDQETIIKLFQQGRNTRISKNDILLEESEYTISDNGVITITNGFTSNDKICIIAHYPEVQDKQYTLKISE